MANKPDYKSHKSSAYDAIEAPLEKQYGLPAGGMRAIRRRGERSDADQVSPVGASTVYQIMPATRDLFLNRYGVDAYASPESAAKVSALHLRDDMKRTGTWEGAVQGYIGGPDKRQHGATTAAYVARVTGQSPRIVSAGSNGATALAPGINLSDFTYDELKDVAPEDLGSRRPLGPNTTPKDPKAEPDQLLSSLLTNGKPLVTPRFDQSPDLVVDKANQTAAMDHTAELAQYGFGDRVVAAIDQNFFLNQIARGMDQEHNEGDPAFHAEYIKNMDEWESIAQTPEERDAMRAAATSRGDLLAAQQRILLKRERTKVIDSNGTGTWFNVGATIADPIGWIGGAGASKVAQLAGRGGTMLAMAAEGGAFGVASTAALDYSGEDQSAGDYLLQGVVGLGIGAALHPLLGAKGSDLSAERLVGEQHVAAQSAAEEIIVRAAANVGEGAEPQVLRAEVERLHTERAVNDLNLTLADVGDENKFMTGDADSLLTGSTATRQPVIDAHGLHAVEDPAEQAAVAEIVARSQRMSDANPINEAGLQGRLLKAFGQESTGLTLLRSKSAVMRATAMQLLEGTTGAAGRRRTAALSQVTRERIYLRHMVEHEDLFHLYRKGEGEGYVSSALSGKPKADFDRRVFIEVERRQGHAEGTMFDTNPAVRKAATNWEKGMDAMRREQQHMGTLGAANLGNTSIGYMRHMIDPRKLMTLSTAQRARVEDALASQFSHLNEYSYIDKATGEKITKAFDQKFSKKLATGYLTRALRRGNGSYDVPMNLHSTEGADIVAEALSAMDGLPKDAVADIIAKFSRGGAGHTKGRLKLDLLTDIGDGKILGDLFRQDILGLYRSYARRVSGEVALAQYGVLGAKGLGLIREAAERTGATADEMHAFDQVASELMNTPYKSAVRHPSLDNLRVATSAARLGGMGFTQLGEYGNALAAVGFKRVMGAIGGANRLRKEIDALTKGELVDNPILNSIDTLGGHLGVDGYQMTRMFDIPDNEIQLYNDEAVGRFGKAVRAGSHMVSVASGHRIIVAVQTRGMAEQIVRKAIGYIKRGENDTALMDMGFTPAVQADIRKNMEHIAEFDSKGNLLKLDLHAGTLDPNLLMTFRDSVERGAGQIIQRTYTGETGAWAHNDLLKTLFQFRTFSLTSIEKQWGRNQSNYGAMKSFAILMGSMSFAVPIHAARMQIKMAGMSEKERKDYAASHMSAVGMARATMNYASSAGLLGDVIDVGTSGLTSIGVMDKATAEGITGGGVGRQSTSGFVPGVGLVDDLLRGTMGGQVSKLPKLLPGANLPYMVPFITAMEPDKN
ncbi:hypothetical protein [Aquisediminimonas sediminicola]|uniref:hypothetical protein n=1 Tax=Alteraquisediminimonas sediminicola TaxID=2676787 RepID=UPI001C8E12DE|nr:hypothetical protein [Aquisediminimonas sediminicola]